MGAPAGADRRSFATGRPARRPPGQRTIRTAASAAAASAGLEPVVKMYVRARLRSRSTSRRDPTTHPPSDPSVFDDVPTRTSSRPSIGAGSVREKTSWASSRTSSAPCRAQSAPSSSAGARSPSIENTESVTTTASSRGRRQQTVEVVEIEVSIDGDRGAAETAPVDDRGVVELVAADGDVGAAEDAEHAEVGGVAGGEDDRRLGLLPPGELVFELVVARPVADHQARGCRPRSPPADRLDRRRSDGRMGAQPEVVVRGERDDRSSVQFAARSVSVEVARRSPSTGSPDLVEFGRRPLAPRDPGRRHGGQIVTAVEVCSNLRAVGVYRSSRPAVRTATTTQTSATITGYHKRCGSSVVPSHDWRRPPMM